MKVEDSYLLKKSFSTSASNFSISFAAEISSLSWLAAAAQAVWISDCFNVFWSSWICCWFAKALNSVLTYFWKNVFILHCCSFHKCSVIISFCCEVQQPLWLGRCWFWLLILWTDLYLDIDWKDKIEEEDSILLNENDRDDVISMFMSWEFDWTCKSLTNGLDILKI